MLRQQRKSEDLGSLTAPIVGRLNPCYGYIHSSFQPAYGTYRQLYRQHAVFSVAMLLLFKAEGSFVEMVHKAVELLYHNSGPRLLGVGYLLLTACARSSFQRSTTQAFSNAWLYPGPSAGIKRHPGRVSSTASRFSTR